MLRLVPPVPAVIALGFVVAGIVLLALGENVGAFAILGVGAVLIVGLAFYAVGRSEDVERERTGST
jgi:uncharacterized membrane protein